MYSVMDENKDDKCNMWRQVHLEQNPSSGIFPSSRWSIAASSIAIIATLSLCYTYNLCYTFLGSATAAGGLNIFLLVVIVRLCPFGGNCRRGYSHFHLLLLLLPYHHLSSYISRGKGLVPKLAQLQLKLSWTQRTLPLLCSPCWKRSKTLLCSSSPLSTLASLLLLLLPACCRVIALKITPAPTAIAAAVAKRAVFWLTPWGQLLP